VNEVFRELDRAAAGEVASDFEKVNILHRARLSMKQLTERIRKMKSAARANSCELPEGESYKELVFVQASTLKNEEIISLMVDTPAP
jgi:hypothetical protein